MYIQENQLLSQLYHNSVKQGLSFSEIMRRIELAKDMIRINKLKGLK